MAIKQSFTQEEWARVAASPMIASMAITAADPSGLWGLLKEALSGGWALLDAKQNATANPLAKEVAEDMTNSETRTAVSAWVKQQLGGAAPAEMKSKAIGELRAVADLVNAKAPDSAAGFLSWLETVAQKAAEAGNEGGFLGFGGVAVSDAERATLSEIKAALGSRGAPTS